MMDKAGAGRQLFRPPDRGGKYICLFFGVIIGSVKWWASSGIIHEDLRYVQLHVLLSERTGKAHTKHRGTIAK